MACRALSQRNSDPTKASRPWDIVMLSITMLISFVLFPILIGYVLKLLNFFVKNKKWYDHIKHANVILVLDMCIELEI